MSAPAAFPEPVRERLAAGAFLLVDKPRGPTSHQATAWARDLLGVERAGHAGTLDPNVSGILWVGVGPALKLLPLLLEFPKRYIGVVVLHGRVAAEEMARAVAEFTGPIFQTPPVRSAVKRERRVRTIHRLELFEFDGTRCLIDVTCDSGTYVRTLAVDLGEALGVGGHLEELRRTGTGPFTEAMAVPLTAVADAAARAREGDAAALLTLLHPIDEVLREFPLVRLKEPAASAVVHGAGLAAGGVLGVSRPFAAGAHVVLTTAAGEALAIGRARAASGELDRVRHGWAIDLERVLAESSRFPPRWGRPAGGGAAAAPGTG